MSPATAPKKKSTFDPRTFLSTIKCGGKFVRFSEKKTICVQNDSSHVVFYILNGTVRLTVLAKSGREATIAILNAGDFFGESCLAGHPLLMSSAIAVTDCSVMRIDKKVMVDLLHREHVFLDMFVAYLVTREIRYEKDLADQRFNSSEKRLARILLLLAHIGEDSKHEGTIPNISQETLSEMVGTTRSRVNFFLNKFRKSGFIDYDGGLEVHSSLFDVVSAD